MMQSWIGTCKSHHTTCHLRPRSDKWLPTRLLDVGSDAESLPPRVIETSGTGAAIYAALSHMWGDVETFPPLRAMKLNYEELKKEIPLRSLPRNFSDAVETCRKLGIRYVWIDSLCIIQDSSEDWKREAQMMHKVYKNAEVTIVA